LKIRNFSVYVLVDRLDEPDHPFYSVLSASPGKTSFALPFRFNSAPPDFPSMGFLTTPTPSGIVLHVSPEALNILESQSRAVCLKDGDWVTNRLKYHSLGALHTLGIVDRLTPQLFSLQDSLPGLTKKFHQIYGTFGELFEALRLTFRRITFACRLFSIAEAIAIIDRNMGDEDVYFGPLLPVLTESCEIQAAKKQFPLSDDIDSPFLVLLNYLRLVFDALKPDVVDLDDQENFFNALHRLEKRRGITIRSFRQSTMQTLISMAQVKPALPLPVFALADIPLTTYRESFFPPLPPIAEPQAEKLVEDVRKVINSAVASLPNPNAKVEWMNRQIRREVTKVGESLETFREQLKRFEGKIDGLSERLRNVMKESTTSLEQMETAERTLNLGFQEQQKVLKKYKALRLELQREQQYTRTVVVLGILLTLLGVVRIFFSR
jgi:hypothetical protein